MRYPRYQGYLVTLPTSSPPRSRLYSTDRGNCRHAERYCPTVALHHLAKLEKAIVAPKARCVCRDTAAPSIYCCFNFSQRRDQYRPRQQQAGSSWLTSRLSSSRPTMAVKSSSTLSDLDPPVGWFERFPICLQLQNSACLAKTHAEPTQIKAASLFRQGQVSDRCMPVVNAAIEAWPACHPCSNSRQAKTTTHALTFRILRFDNTVGF